MADDKMKLLQVRGGPGFEPNIITLGRTVVVLKASSHIILELVFAFQGQGYQLAPD